MRQALQTGLAEPCVGLTSGACGREDRAEKGGGIRLPGCGWRRVAVQRRMVRMEAGSGLD